MGDRLPRRRVPVRSDGPPAQGDGRKGQGRCRQHVVVASDRVLRVLPAVPVSFIRSRPIRFRPPGCPWVPSGRGPDHRSLVLFGDPRFQLKPGRLHPSASGVATAASYPPCCMGYIAAVWPLQAALAAVGKGDVLLLGEGTSPALPVWKGVHSRLPLFGVEEVPACACAPACVTSCRMGLRRSVARPPLPERHAAKHGWHRCVRSTSAARRSAQ